MTTGLMISSCLTLCLLGGTTGLKFVPRVVPHSSKTRVPPPNTPAVAWRNFFAGDASTELDYVGAGIRKPEKYPSWHPLSTFQRSKRARRRTDLYRRESQGGTGELETPPMNTAPGHGNDGIGAKCEYNHDCWERLVCVIQPASGTPTELDFGIRCPNGEDCKCRLHDASTHTSEPACFDQTTCTGAKKCTDQNGGNEVPQTYNCSDYPQTICKCQDACADPSNDDYIDCTIRSPGSGSGSGGGDCVLDDPEWSVKDEMERDVDMGGVNRTAMNEWMERAGYSPDAHGDCYNMSDGSCTDAHNGCSNNTYWNNSMEWCNNLDHENYYCTPNGYCKCMKMDSSPDECAADLECVYVCDGCYGALELSHGGALGICRDVGVRLDSNLCLLMFAAKLKGDRMPKAVKKGLIRGTRRFMNSRAGRASPLARRATPRFRRFLRVMGRRR